MKNQFVLFISPDEAFPSKAIKTICQAEKLNNKALGKKSSAGESITDIRPIGFSNIFLDSGQVVHLLKVDDKSQLIPIKGKWQEAGIGAIVLVEHRDAGSVATLRQILTDYEQYLTGKSLAIGIIPKADDPLFKLDEYNASLLESGYNTAVFEVDPANYQDIAILLQSMLYASLYGVDCAKKAG